MPDGLLSAVITLENQIQQQLQQEQSRADSWLAGVRAEVERYTVLTAQELAAEDEKLLDEAERKAIQEAEALLASQEEYCQRLEQLSEQALARLLKSQMHRILPG